MSGADYMTPDLLPRRMRSVLQLVVDGNSTAEIADRLGLTENTVQDCRKALLTVFRARNAAQLAAYAVATGHATVDVPEAVRTQERTLAAIDAMRSLM